MSYFFCTRNRIWSLVTEAKEKCKLLRDEDGAELGMLDFTWQNAWTCWKPHVDSAMVWGFPQRGAVVTYRVGKTQHVPEREWTPLLAEAGTKGCGYVLCTMPLVTHKCKHGVPVSITDTCPVWGCCTTWWYLFSSWVTVAFEGYPGLYQTTDKTGSPNTKVWDQDPSIVRDLFWSSPVHTVIERIWNLSF